MDFYSTIETRTSIKDFKNTPIDSDKLSRIINAAMMAPSWKNKTCYKIIIIDDKNKKNSIASAITNNTDLAAEAVKTAPIVSIVVADPEKSGIVNGKEYYLVDSAIAMEHFILAATNEGYGTCWIGAFDEDKVKSILNIPDNYRVVAMTPVGEVQNQKPHYESKDIQEYVFLNTWNESYTNKR